MKKILISIISILVTNNILFAQNIDFDNYNKENSNKYVLYDYQFDILKVLNTNKIYYYGLDFSNTVLVNSKKIGTEDKLQSVFPNLISKFEELKPPDRYLRDWLKKDEFILVQQNVQNRYKLIEKDWIKFSPNNIDIEKVISIIKDYKSIITETEGVGFVVIVENFKKNNEKVTSISTFFDIKTGEILWASKTIGIANGAGFTKHWAIGIMSSLRNFIDKVYKDEYKKEKI